ncbi:hypothetical protein [Pseudomonas phage vB_PseuGesM_254]|uniref:Tail fiber protein n=1 Tax=Pseudomonas phage vB_PseuGesM_254 TaxID=3092638 RepID=A0AAX4G6L6_9CAUD|nr:hypothetical protein [Pseudomonas phage PseuGes_254]
MTKISVTRALAQIKSLNAKIQRATAAPFIALAVGGKPQNFTGNAQEVETQLRANLQSVQDLIEQRDKLKVAIVKSNAITSLEVNGKIYTVAGAIEHKGSVEFMVALANQLQAQSRQAIQQVERANVDVEKRLEQLTLAAAGKDRKVDPEELAAIRDPFIKNNAATIIDPSNIQQVVEKLLAEIEEFKLNVDFALSESNAVTLIEV